MAYLMGAIINLKLLSKVRNLASYNYVSDSNVDLFNAGIKFLLILLDIPSRLFSLDSVTFYIIIYNAFYT